ncbi:MAG: GFA family protein [Polyangiaceae bacterium]
MKKTHQGSCHCGAVRFECEVDLSAGTTRCNCSFCRKARFWMVFAKAAEFRLLAGQEVLTDYQYSPSSTKQPFLHLLFCQRCGFRAFTKGGALPQFGGEFYAVNVACLDGVSEQELSELPVHYADGLNDDWQTTPKFCSHL